MLTPKVRRLLVFVLLLSLAAAGFFGWRGSTVPLEHVASTLPAGETVYGLDQGAEVFRFFHIDGAGNILEEIRRPTRRDGMYYVYSPLIPDGGEIYVMEQQVDAVSNRIQREAVYRCDFKSGQLRLVWQLPILDDTQTSNFAVQVKGGVLTCLQIHTLNPPLPEVQVFRARLGGELEKVSAFSYEGSLVTGFTEFYCGASGTVAFTTPDGQVFTVKGGQKPEKRFPLGAGSKPLLLFANDGADRVFVAGADRKVYVIDLAGRGRAELFFDGATQGYPMQGMGALSVAPDGSFAAALHWGKTLGMFRAAGNVEIHALFALPGRIALRAALGFLGAWLAAAAVALLVRFFFFLTRGKVPIVTKLLAALLPILIISMTVMNAMVTRVFERQMVDNQYKQLYLLSQQKITVLDDGYVTAVDPAAPYVSVYFDVIRHHLNVLPDQAVIYEEGEAAQNIQNSSYFWLYKMMDGKLISLCCEQDYIGVPIEERYPAEVVERFYQAAETKQSVRTRFQDSLGEWTALLSPVMEDGRVVGVVETGDTELTLIYAIARGVRLITLQNLAVLAVLVLLLSCVIAYSLQPLGTLRERVQQISDGTLGVQTPERSNDEITEISRVFNTMSRNVAIRDKEIRLTSEGYSRFVPARVFGLLEKSSVIDVRLEDQTSVEAVVLNCSVSAFDSIARQLRSREMFRLINQVLAKLVPVVDQSGGLVDRFDRAGLLAIYTDRPDKALDAAVTLCQTLRGAKLDGTEGQALSFHVTLSAGPAMIGIVGAEQRLEAMTISEHTSFTGFLRPLAADYGASILMTGSAAGMIDGFETRYHVRTIGFVRMNKLDQLERLYDVYDGDGETQRRLKEETQEMFEKGVALFCTREYYDARLLFIEVLKRNREDKAAKNYLYLCDTYYREDGDKKRDVWIDAY